MTSVTRIDETTHREIVDALRDLLARAETHRLRGFGFFAKTGPNRMLMGVTGEYWRDPFQALAGVTRMEYKVNQLISSRDDEPETGHMPL